MVAGGQEIDVIHLDLSKAFDKVSHDLLLTKLHRHGISGTALRWFEGYLSNRQQRVVLEGTFSDWLPVTSGVPQGSILRPLLFLVFANKMPSYVQHGSSLALFADDSKLYRPLGSVSSSASLQSDLDGLHSWSSDHKMTFNTTKCKVLRMSKRRSCRKPLNTYYLGEEILSHSPQTSDLGVSVSGKCTWTSHIEQMCSKANRVLGLVKRLCGRDIRDVQTRKLLYTALVRPLLEYSSSVWSPYFVKHRRLIENIQRRATKFILNYPPREVSYINRLDQLNLLPLDFRRQMHDLVLLFKCKTGTVTSNFGRFIHTVTRHYRTHNFHQANFDLLSRHNQEYYCNSYFPRTVKLWNSLPNILKSSQDLLWFRVHLYEHFRGLLQTYSPP